MISQSTEMAYAAALQSSHFGNPDNSETAGGGSGFSRYLHALRRRWLISLVIALPLAAGAACGAWVLQPQQYTTSYVLQIKHGEENLVFTTADQARGAAGSSVDTFKRTQRVAIRQRGLIERALDPDLHPGLLKLPVLRKAAPDEVGWIEKHLSVTFPEDSEIMYVSLTADDPKGLHEILQSIVAEYFDSVVAFERDKKMERFTNLENTMTDAESELRKKQNEVRSFVERVGHADKQALSIVQQNALAEHQVFMQRFGQVRYELMQKETELEHRRALETAPEQEIPVTSTELTAALQSDPVARAYENERESLVNQIEKNKEKLKPEKAAEAVAEFARRLEANDKKLETRKVHVRKVLVERKRLAATTDIEVLEQEVVFLKKQFKKLEEETQKLDRKAREAGKSSVDVEMMMSEVGVLKGIAEHLRTEHAKTKVELGKAKARANDPTAGDTWSRVRKLAQAGPARPVDSKTRIVTTVGVGGMSFLLPFVLFIALDASKNRISTGAEVTQAVGLSVIGAVPILPQRVIRRLNGPSETDKYWRALLSESVDSIAAVLLKGTQPGTSRVIMVSSANAGEGKTTLAAHLAVSLAGAGRHPVLVDFDLRRPALHRVFGVSLQPGVNEILRDGHEFEATLQATQIPNLMMLSAGRTSKLGLGGLVAADLQALFSKLRSEFDFVIVDACPILPVVDTRLIGQHVDAVLLSVLRDVSRAPKLRQACDLLDMFRIPMLGVVVTGSSEELYRDAGYGPLSEPQAV